MANNNKDSAISLLEEKKSKVQQMLEDENLSNLYVYHYEMLEWIQFSIEQWTSGGSKKVQVGSIVQEGTDRKSVIHKYEDIWYPRPINYDTFMAWKLNKL